MKDHSQRRKFLKQCLSLAAVNLQLQASVLIKEQRKKVLNIKLEASFKPRQLLPKNVNQDNMTMVMAYNQGFPIIRIRQGHKLRVHFTNKLNQDTTIHWHGLRLPNAMDGVPILTQDLIKPSQSFVYEFDCPDAGSFWFHTHINSFEQMGQGLIGVLIVEDETKTQFDKDLVFAYHDLSLNKDDGSHFSELGSLDSQAAAKGGLHGNFYTINGKPLKDNFHNVIAGSVIRLRILNTDSSRIMKLSLFNGKQQYDKVKIIAIDGNAIAKPIDLNRYRIGPAMRLDLAIAMPEKIGEQLVLKNVFAKIPYTLGVLNTVGSKKISKKLRSFPPIPKLNPISEPDLRNAQVLNFEFSNMAIRTKDKLIFWGINKTAWNKENIKHKGDLPAPIARLELGKTYIFRLHNISKFSHPIHIHGHTWLVLSSSKKKTLTGYHTDTVLIKPRERMDLAFVADNPGQWMYHCHIIDHMMTGMMSYVVVS